ncbi:tyrosine-type recombinase/integrase [Halobacillus halophilus]|uniref:tyrosine-type recombinase/integrase n=1 Tax=Halobacillus halophilus TaxID=1570 RepID=UPI001371B68A|nr:tyrosine-type recombinase/integrase [Halobacillus halophilus]MYL30746.1 tyrosine-type recombinase/integrase [Halobacillus halophilus]
MRRNLQLSSKELATLHNDFSLIQISFQDSLELFLDDCKIRNLRPHTINYYRNELNVYYKHLREQDIDPTPSKVTSDIIKKHVILFMKEQGKKTVTINTRLRAIRSYFNFLHREKYLKTNPMYSVKLLKDREAIVDTFTNNQLNDLLRQPDLHTFIGVRDYTIMLLLLETGLRANEVSNLSIHDIKLKEGVLHVRHSKTYYQRIVPFQNTMSKMLERWFSIRGICDCDSLFITIDETPLTKRQLQSRISYYGKKADLKGVRCSCHTFRHTFARMCVVGGADPFTLQRLLGHTDLSMTKRYVNLFSEEINNNHKKFSPLKNLEKRI